MPAEEPHDPAKPRVRLAWRIAPATLSFILDTQEISRNDRDLVDSLLFAAILAANMTPVSRDDDLQLAYAAADQAAPDDLRRPVSVSAIAHSLRMPFETARRRVAGLARAGAVEITPRGVIVPNTIVTGPAFVAAIVARHDRLGGFYKAVRDAGALSEADGPPAAIPGSPPVRVTNRAIWEYMLRVTDDLVSVAGDPLSSLILLEMIRQNTDHLAAEALAGWARDPAGVGRPARTTRLAAQLALSTETTRRYTIALEAAGFCRRAADGLVATAPPSARPALERLADDNLANVQRMFARLRPLGALAAWES